jgi:hypothetical protein
MRQELIAFGALSKPTRGDMLHLFFKDLVYRVTFLMQLKDQIHKLAFLVPGIVQI